MVKPNSVQCYKYFAVTPTFSLFTVDLLGGTVSQIQNMREISSVFCFTMFCPTISITIISKYIENITRSIFSHVMLDCEIV